MDSESFKDSSGRIAPVGICETEVNPCLLAEELPINFASAAGSGYRNSADRKRLSGRHILPVRERFVK